MTRGFGKQVQHLAIGMTSWILPTSYGSVLEINREEPRLAASMIKSNQTLGRAEEFVDGETTPCETLPMVQSNQSISNPIQSDPINPRIWLIER
jgi:hypothetical protein